MIDKEARKQVITFIFVLGLTLLFNINLTIAESGSTSVYNVQYSNPFGSTYDNLMNGPLERTSAVSSESEFYDIEFFIPPAGCQPYVVRSDLLEEQNVPVFCQLVPLKVNPTLEIERIESINVVQKGTNPYISGVGFHPAKAAIKSSSSISNLPSADNIGYVVVVLKRQQNEQSMPDFVNVTLAATLKFRAEGGFGIGKSEFYIPQLTQEEFESNYLDYSFYEGLGYLRVENIEDNFATISLYGSESKSGSFRKIFSERIEKGKTSKDIYLSNSFGGRGIRITLKDLDISQTKAKIRVNNNIFEVLKGGSFYDGKCRLLDLETFTAGTGKAKISCSGISTTINLEKRINKVSLSVEGYIEKDFSLGENINLETDTKTNYYLIYAGKTDKNFVVIAKIDKAKTMDFSSSQLSKSLDALTKDITNELASKPEVSNKNSFQSLGSISFITLSEGETKLNIKFNELKLADTTIDDEARAYLEDAVESYDEVKSSYGDEKKSGQVYSYGELALWNSYELVNGENGLGQKTLGLEILSRIESYYPNSIWKGFTATQRINSFGAVSSSTSVAKYYDAKTDISLELMSITSPSSLQAGVDLTYVLDSDSGISKGLNAGDTFYSQGDVSLTLSSFDESRAFISYSCKNGAEIKSDKIPFELGKQASIVACKNIRILVNNINIERVANIKIDPITNGRSKEANFSFSIGIEKRAFALNLTPEEANEKIKDLNEQISNYKNITESLGKIIEMDKMACLATSVYVNIKNLFKGKSGEATARTEVMGGWNQLCEDSNFRESESKGAVDFEDCIAKNSDTIETDVKAMTETLQDLKQENEDAGNLQENIVNGRADSSRIFSYQVSELQQSSVLNDLVVRDSSGQDTRSIGNEKVRDIIKGINTSSYHISQSEFEQLKRNIVIAQEDSGFSEQAQLSAKKSLYATLATVKERQDFEDRSKLNFSSGLPVSRVISGLNNREVYSYEGKLGKDLEQMGIKKGNLEIADGDKVAIVADYLFILEGDEKSIMIARKVYQINSSRDISEIKDSNTRTNILSRHAFQKETTLRNSCKNCDYVKVFSLEPYKGNIAVLPIDKERGWYVYSTQDLPAGFGLGSSTSKTYFSSGALNNFYLCNVGSNGLIEEGYGDDVYTCIKFDLSTGQPSNQIGGLSESEARRLVSDAQKYVRDAQRQLGSGNTKTIRINGMTLNVQNSEGNIGSKCTDFMSYKDCKLVFNVCDPVVCPNSRCDLGGKFRVDNVISSGIVGSTLLCLPNFVAFPGGDVYVPVCLTGIHAGIEGWVSVLESYRDCINESVRTGKTVGICDEIHSVYVCDFFWRQIGPFVNSMFKNIFSFVFGGNEKGRGGGEYAFTSDAWARVEKSMSYFQTTYAKDSNLAFGVKDLTNSVVAQVCKTQTSATFPDSFDAMLEPESPIQFYANFEEIPYTDATVPPRSQYKVYYHIYAGNDEGHYYQIYLKNAPESLGYVSKDSSIVASGYVAAGGRKDETRDFIEVAGFKELCVRIDNVDRCGFKSVSTSFAVNYAQDMAKKEQATSTVSSEKECISGSTSLGSLITPNIQQAVEESVNPELYNQGIIRVCAARNPGETTQPTRWKDVGKCDVETMRCWLDTESVENSIIGAGLENATLSEIEKINIANLQKQEGYLIDKLASDAISNFKIVYMAVAESVKSDNILGSFTSQTKNYLGEAYGLRTMNNLEEDYAALEKKLIMSTDKANLGMVKAEIYAEAARQLSNLFVPAPVLDEVSEDIQEPIVDSGKFEEIRLTLNQGIPDKVLDLMTLEYAKLDGLKKNLYFYKIENSNYFLGLNNLKESGGLVKEIRELSGGKIEWVYGDRQVDAMGNKILKINNKDINFVLGQIAPSEINLIAPTSTEVSYTKMKAIKGFWDKLLYGYSVSGASEILELTLPTMDSGKLGSITDRNGEQLFGGRGVTAQIYTLKISSDVFSGNALDEFSVNTENPNVDAELAENFEE